MRSKTTKHPRCIKYFNELFRGGPWTYQSIPEPQYLHLTDPLIQFLLKPISSSVINDGLKLEYLLQSSGFINPNPNQKLMDIFSTPLQPILTGYPQSIKTIADLEAAGKVKPPYEPITLALEAERLAYEYENTLSMQEFVILNQFNTVDREKNHRTETIYVCNINAFFTQLKHKTVQRTLNTQDCEDLIKNYRFAMAHNLMQDLPLIRHEAYDKIKLLLSKLSVEKQLASLKSLVKPEVINSEDFGIFNFDRKYDGYIANPDFRNWVIEKLTDLLATELGKDDGSSDYVTRIKSVIEDIGTNTVGITQLTILSTLATKINAQKEVAYLMRDTYNNNSVKSALAKSVEGIAVELCMNQSSKDPILSVVVQT